VQRKWKVLLLVSVGSFMAFLDAPVLSVAFPALKETFADAGATTLAWTLDAYFIGFAAFLVAAGKAADRYGRKQVFVTGMWLFSVASLACALAPSVGTLIAARALQAVGAAMVVPAGQGLMLAEFPPQDRKTAIGVLAALVGLGTAVAPTIGGVLVDGVGWRWIFAVNVAVGLAGIAYARWLLVTEPKTARTLAERPDALGAAMQALSLGLLVYAILKCAHWGFDDARTLVLFALAVVLGAVFLRRSQRHPAPVVELGLFKDRTFAVANAGSVFLGLGLYAMAINSVLYFTSVWGWTILATGLAFIPGALASALTGRPAGRLADRHGPRLLSAFGALLAGTGVLLIAVSVTDDANFAADYLPGQLLYAVGVVAGMTGLVGAAITAAPAAQFALASGINSALRQVGGAIGVALVAAIVGDAVGAPAAGPGQAAWIVAGVSLLVSGAIAFLMRPAAAAAAAPVLVSAEERA